jgi:hypothetical protein
MTEDEDDFAWVSELFAGFCLAALIAVFTLITFVLFGYLAARLGFI